MRVRLAALLTMLSVAMLPVAGCSGANGNAPVGTENAGGGGGVPHGTVTVFAASSLTETFRALGKDFEDAYPGTKVTFNFAGSSGLAQQIGAGSPADVFAAASTATMKTVTDAGEGAGAPVTFARNQLVIAVRPGNPKQIASLQDLARPKLTVVICAVQVPCGATAQALLTKAGVQLKPASLEQDVKAALTKVKLGEADAALVYRTDTRAAKDVVDTVEFPESRDEITDYQIVALKGAPNPTGAQAFLRFLASEHSVNVLTKAGFQQP
jgi:molybdate transport system substrate-binding protein